MVRDGTRIVDASSTVTAVCSDDSLLIIDTGAASEVDGLATALAEAGKFPEDVALLVNTHLHADHCGCNEMFVNARRYAHHYENPPIGTTGVEEGVEICRGVTIIETPGHTRGCISVLVRSDVDYVVCGDALPTKSNYDAMAPPGIHFDRRLAMSSMKRIIQMADIVIPGHDAPFRVMGKK